MLKKSGTLCDVGTIFSDRIVALFFRVDMMQFGRKLKHGQVHSYTNDYIAAKHISVFIL